MRHYETIKLELADRVATLTLARPDRLNALTPQLFEEALAAVEEVVKAGARALILTGEGRAFCSGADITVESGKPVPTELGEILDRYYNPFVRRLAEIDIPVVTAINGPAVGAGLSLALLGDIILAARSSYMLLSFVNIGLVPDAGATWLVAQAVGRTRALEMALLGEKMEAQEAQACGLVTRVVDDAALMTTARDIAARLANGPTVAVAMIRKQIAAALTQGLEDTLVLERANQNRAGETADFREALRAFAEKRAPLFKGE